MVRFLIADTFTTSLRKLTNDEQSFVKNTAFDLQVNPTHPGLQFHRIERAKDKNFWSVRSGRDLRIIIHKTDADFLLCYVNHHNAAYEWAERRKLQTHPETGAAQLVEIREKVQEFVQPRFIEPKTMSEVRKPFAGISVLEMLGYGVPQEWIEAVRESTDDSLFDLFVHLPSEAAEALLELATGGNPKTSNQNSHESDPFDHPDSKRRFTLISSSEELSRALQFPWDKWTVFLHPEQRGFVEKNFNGPARVSGSAGTGKTVVALHRAHTLAARNPDKRVLLATFSDSLARALQTNLDKLVSNQPRLGEQIEVVSLPSLIKRLYEGHFGKVRLATEPVIKQFIADEKDRLKIAKFSNSFLWKEWEQIVDPWQIQNWDQYRVVPRLGRKTRLTEDTRKILWRVFENVQTTLDNNGLITEPKACQSLSDKFKEKRDCPFDFAVIDEAQDISVPQLRLLSTMLAQTPNGLFFAGDLGQRIFQQPFSWTSLGVDIRGRSKTLKINYRTSQEIRLQSDRLLESQFTDIDGLCEDRTGTISVFSGPEPHVIRPESTTEESNQVANWIQKQLTNGILQKEICIIVRSENEIPRAFDAVSKTGCKSQDLNDGNSKDQSSITVSTMHLAKGLEYRAVVVMACDDDVVPLQSRIESVGDDADLQEIYTTERQLLYVACTRARDCLLLSGVKPASEFLDDFEGT
jgi:superfamily I DNA/RNA helicase/mRNA-degrading endonuclease RelE of RelBE toxin-antitoxin system